MEKHNVAQLRQIAKENGLQGYSKLRKAELIEFIKNPPLPRARHIGVRKRVTLQPVEGDKTSTGELVFPSISAAAKHFNVNPGVFGKKLISRKESTRNFIKLDGKKFTLRFEAYCVKEKQKIEEE